MLGACVSASSATVYKWVDDNGVTHYSDQPNPKAQKLEIGNAQTYGAKQAAVAAPVSPVAPAATQAAVCAIDAPGNGAVLIDTYTVSGHVTMTHVPPNSQPTLTLDGQDITGQLQTDGSFVIQQVDRGDHVLRLDVPGCQGTAVTFSVRQRSAGGANAVPMAPQAPAAPKAPGVGVAH